MPSPLDIEEAERRYRRALLHVKLTKQIREMEVDVQNAGATAQGVNEFLNLKMKRLLDRIGVYADIRPSYHAYARQLNRTQRDLPDQVDRTREWTILRDRWQRRGLDPTILGQIDRLVRIDI